ncbi:hypothetical protein RD792_004886 [Penstemon davidsonii]|uniref:Glycosyltransferase n=1 Tax=Penstemon davidsonii TaxID=160366 RepID=A0ABR0DIQ0_9LAMI|nr:hypothetical protein RD792_004886 [Penstemon davidsonii]
MDREQVSNPKPHVLVIPFIIQGHINPMLQFSKFLALKSSLKITFILTSTTTKIAKIPNDKSIRIKFISDVPEEDIQEPNNNSPETFFKNFKPTVSKNLIELINEEKDAKVIVYDSVMPWVLDIAHEKGLLGAAFFTHSCSVSALHYHLKQGTLKHPFEPSSEISLPFMPSLDIKDFPSYPSDGIFMDPLKFHVDQFSNIEKVDWIFFNTFEKLETEIAKWMFSQWPIKTIGPTCLLPKTSTSQVQIEPNNKDCIKWLDSKDVGSVVYVSFGSLVSLKQEQMEELGQGLIMSKCNFLWVVRAKEKIPQNFTSLASNKGLIVKWCPQVEVLSHRAIACFMTHCGWNSTLEALSYGVPLIGMAQWSDQPTNCKFVWREEIVECVKEIVHGEKGKVLGRNAQFWKNLAKEAVGHDGGTSIKNIQDFTSQLLYK